uniref:Polycystin domain-containing protein n=1 Tax=Panagrolaimus sp. ES5 TaxID=591445 RepID=A0AC34EZQ1_9BILA
MMHYSRDSVAYHYRLSISDLFNCGDNPKRGSQVSFLEIKKREHFWTWAQTDLANGILASFPDRPAYNLRGYFNDKSSRSVGIGHIRQIRSSEYKDCPQSIYSSGPVKKCIDFDSPEETTSAYSIGWKNVINSSVAEYPYIFRSPKELDGLNHFGKVREYSAG